MSCNSDPAKFVGCAVFWLTRPNSGAFDDNPYNYGRRNFP